MLDELREDFRRHGSRFGEPALWAMAVFRFGQRVRTMNGAPRAVASKVYGGLRMGVEMSTGISLHSETRVGEKLHLIHGANIRIHPDVVIGNRVGIMHDVTIGLSEGDGAPVIEDDVFIGPGAKILGAIRVGAGAHIAANSLVITDVPAGATMLGVPARPLPKRKPKPG